MTTVQVAAAVLVTLNYVKEQRMPRKKKDKKTKDLLKMLAGIRGKERQPMPRPTVFKDKTKYSRKRNKSIDFD